MTNRKILAINGSHHGDNSYTRFLLERLFEGAREEGADCEVITLANLSLNRCIGCDACQKTDAIPVDPDTFSAHCVWDGKDDGQMIFQKMITADIIIYATPVQVFGMSGLMKNFLDRFYALGNSGDICLSGSGLMFHFIDHRVVSKPFVAMISCSNLENETPLNTISYFRTFSRFMDAPMVGMLIRNGSIMVGKGKDQSAEERFPSIREVYAAYQQAGRELAQSGKIHRSTERCANREFIPVPMFSLLKRIPFRRVKEKFIERVRQNTGCSQASLS